MNFSATAKYGGLLVAAAALTSFFISLDYMFNNKSSLLIQMAWCAVALAAGLIASAFGEIATQLKRRADAADEANRIAERRLNIEAATLASNAAPKS